jgi:hypothetical protein
LNVDIANTFPSFSSSCAKTAIFVSKIKERIKTAIKDNLIMKSSLYEKLLSHFEKIK